MAFDARDGISVHELAVSPTRPGEEVVEGLKHQVAVVADDLVPDVVRACGEVPDEVELIVLCSDFSNGPEEVALRIHECYGPEGVVGRLVVLRQ